LAMLPRTIRAQVVIGWMAKAQLYGGSAAAVAGVPSLWYQVGRASAGSAVDRLATLLPARAILFVSRAGREAQRLG
jgi:hypothetical protein